MRKVLTACLFVAMIASGASAMPVSEVLTKAEALKKKGAMAVFSSDLRLIKNELETSGKQLRDERRATLKAGGKPAYCPPAKGNFDSDELLAYLRTIPPAQRGMSFKAAYKSFLVKKFPCKA